MTAPSNPPAVAVPLRPEPTAKPAHLVHPSSTVSQTGPPSTVAHVAHPAAPGEPGGEAGQRRGVWVVGRLGADGLPVALPPLPARVASARCGARSTWSPPCATPCARTGSATPTSSPGPGAPARPPPPASSPRSSTARHPVDGEPCCECASCLAIEARHLLRRPRARRGLEQRRRGRSATSSPRRRSGTPGRTEGVHPRRGPHALARRRPTPC